MSTFRATSSIPRMVCRPVSRSGTPTRAMASLFPRFPSNDFAPFFRLLDATDPFIQSQTSTRSFVPKFDVRELGSAYELQGELPGIKQEDIDIEFVDANTLVIRGKAERQSTQNSEDSAIVEQPATAQPAVPANGTEKSFQKATVEDDYVDAGVSHEASEDSSSTTSAQATPAQTAPATTAKIAEPSYKYWVSERSIGQFERRFSFPGKVDVEAVKASLREG